MRQIATSGDFCNATEGVSGSASAILVASSLGVLELVAYINTSGRAK